MRSPGGLGALAAAALSACAGPRPVTFAPVPDAEAGALRSVHDWRGGAGLCQACHVNGAPAPALHRGNPVALCTGCHRQSHAGNHPVDVPAQGPAAGVPLWNGRVTCSSCHDPHAIRVRKGIRGEGSEVCLGCHRKHVRGKAG